MASYKQAVAWIAENDDTSDLVGDDPLGWIPTVTVSMVADLWGKEWEVTAKDVRRYLRSKGEAAFLNRGAAA